MDILNRNKEKTTPKFILNLVENELNLKNLKSPIRTRERVQARFIYFKLAKTFCRYASLSAIGREVERDHATVLHGLAKYDEEAKYDIYMNDVYDKLYNDITLKNISPAKEKNIDKAFQLIFERLTKVETQLNLVTNEN